MTFKEIREEFVARGFDDLEESSVRVKRWANQAYAELCEEKPWPFLQVSTKEGTAPLTISDLAHVLSAVDKTGENPLVFADERELVQRDPALTSTGSAMRWYRASETSIKVWPLDTTSTFLVRYQKVPAEFSADGDVPLVPTRYHDLIVDGMTIKAYKNKDNFEEVQTLRLEWERGVRQMVRALLQPNYDGPRFVQRTGRPGDYA